MKRPLVHRFSEIWRTDAGHKVRLSIQDAPDISQEGDFQPRRIAVVEHGSPASAGTVVYGQDTSYLLINQTNLTDLQRFRAMEITHRLPWTRVEKITDLVSGMSRSAGTVTLNGALPVVVEPERTIVDRGFDRAKNVIYTGADVRPGDLIGPYEVESIVILLGVKKLEVL